MRRRPRRRQPKQRVKKLLRPLRHASQPQLILPREPQLTHRHRQLCIRQCLEVGGDDNDRMRRLQTAGPVCAPGSPQPVPQSKHQIAPQPDNPGLSVEDAQHRVTHAAGSQRQSTAERPVQRSHPGRIPAKQDNGVAVA